MTPKPVQDNPRQPTPLLCEALFRDLPEHDIRDVLLQVHTAERHAASNRELLANMLGILAEAARVKFYLP